MQILNYMIDNTYLIFGGILFLFIFFSMDWHKKLFPFLRRKTVDQLPMVDSTPNKLEDMKRLYWEKKALIETKKAEIQQLEADIYNITIKYYEMNPQPPPQ